MQRWVRRAATLVALIVICLSGMAAGARLAGSQTHHTALGDVQVTVAPAWSGSIDLYIPLADWGVRARAFHAPLRLTATPRSLNRPALIATAAGDHALLDQAQADAEHAGRAAVLRGLAAALIGGVISTLLAGMVIRGRHRPWKCVLTWTAGGVLCSLATACVVGLCVAKTVDIDAFENPTFFARGAELRQLLEASEHLRESTDSYQSRVKHTIRNLAGLLDGSAGRTAPALEDGGEPTVRAALVSDLHDNVFVLRAARSFLADQPVFWAGDFGHAGDETEAQLLAGVARMGRPVVAVSGNHDSELIMRKLAEGGAIVLNRAGRLSADGTVTGPPVIRVAGLRVAAFDDPLEDHGDDPGDPQRIFSFSELPDGAARLRQAEQELIDWFDALPVRPDVVIVHQNAMAQALAGELASRKRQRPLTILTGHDHKQHVDPYGPVTVVDGGTVGAGGQFGVGREKVGFAQLAFGRRSGTLKTADLVQVEPTSGTAQAERVVAAHPDCSSDLVRCRPERHGGNDAPRERRG